MRAAKHTEGRWRMHSTWRSGAAVVGRVLMASKVAVVDGANIAYAELSAEGQPKVSNLLAVRHKLRELGYEPIIIVDATLRHEIDDPDQLEALIDDQVVRQAPASTDADYFVLETAHEHDGALVVSNDTFQEYRDAYPALAERRVPLMIIWGEVQLYEIPEAPGDDE